MFKGIIKRVMAAAVAAASLFLAVIFLGVAIFHALSLVTTPLGASAITFALFALVALIVALVFLKGGEGSHDEDEDDAPDSLVGKVVHLVRERPIIGAAGGLGALFLLLRNPALAAIVASMVADRKMDHGSHSRRRRR